VRDVAQLYRRLLECTAAGEVVNLCSGVGHRLDGVLETLRRLTGHDLEVRSSRSLVRTNEIPELVGSTEKLRRLIGGLTFRPIDETLRWMHTA
jgi:hypothetical protein